MENTAVGFIPRLLYLMFWITVFDSINSTKLPSITAKQLPSYNGIVHKDGGQETSPLMVATTYDCSMLCRSTENCMGFIYVSSTSVCQLHQSTQWCSDPSLVLSTLSAMFYAIADINEVTCLAGWDRYLGSCYLFDTSHMTSTYLQAKTICESHGAILVHINHELENNFVKQRCMTLLDTYGSTWACWLGISDSGHEGDWRWFDNGEALTFTDWEPSNPNEGTGANCGALYHLYGYAARWVDESCSQNFMPICELNMA